MRTLVVGGAGFIGSHLADRLLAEGHVVDIVDDLSTGAIANLADARTQGSEGRLKFHNVDATSSHFGDLVALRRPEVIFHLAALAPGAQPGANAIASTLAMLDAARDAGVTKVVGALPAEALYGDVSPRDLPLKEDRGFAPSTVEGVVARTIVDLFDVYRARHEVEFTMLAIADVYGPRQRAGDGLVARLRAAAATGEAPRVGGDERQTRDLVFIDDTVDALVRGAQRGSGLVVNIGTGVQTPVRDLWERIGGPGRLPVRPGPPDDGRPARFALSAVRARIHLAWEPWTTLDEGLRAMGRTAP